MTSTNFNKIAETIDGAKALYTEKTADGRLVGLANITHTHTKLYQERKHCVGGEMKKGGFRVKKKNHTHTGTCIYENGTRLFNWWKKHGTDKFSAIAYSFACPQHGENTMGFHYLVRCHKDNSVWDGSNGAMDKYTEEEWEQKMLDKDTIDSIELSHEDMVGIGKKIYRVGEFELDKETMFRCADWMFHKLGDEVDGKGRIDKTKGAVWYNKKIRKMKKKAMKQAKQGKFKAIVRNTGKIITMRVVDGIIC